MKKNIEKKGSILSSDKQYGIQDLRSELFKKTKGSTLDKINSFTKFTGRQNIAKLIAKIVNISFIATSLLYKKNVNKDKQIIIDVSKYKRGIF